LGNVRYRDTSDGSRWDDAPAKSGGVHPIVPIVLLLGLGLGVVALMHKDPPPAERTPQVSQPIPIPALDPQPRFNAPVPNRPDISQAVTPAPAQAILVGDQTQPQSTPLPAIPLAGTTGAAAAAAGEAISGAFAPLRPAEVRPLPRVTPMKIDPRRRRITGDPPTTTSR
jgi:hypothetical protein